MQIKDLRRVRLLAIEAGDKLIDVKEKMDSWIYKNLKSPIYEEYDRRYEKRHRLSSSNTGLSLCLPSFRLPYEPEGICNAMITLPDDEDYFEEKNPHFHIMRTNTKEFLNPADSHTKYCIDDTEFFHSVSMCILRPDYYMEENHEEVLADRDLDVLVQYLKASYTGGWQGEQLTNWQRLVWLSSLASHRTELDWKNTKLPNYRLANKRLEGYQRKGLKKDGPSMEQKKNRATFKDTMQRIADSPELMEAVCNSREYAKVYDSHELQVDIQERRFCEHTDISVLDGDFLTWSQMYELADGERIGILDAANAIHPGEGILDGVDGQEQRLCRCSTLYSVLAAQRMQEEFYREHGCWRLEPDKEMIAYVPDVLILRDGESEKMLERPLLVDVIVCAPPDGRWEYAPKVTRAELLQIMERKVRSVLEIAAEKKISVLVLGDWDCQHFLNQPDLMAKAFRNVLWEEVEDAPVPGMKRYQQFSRILFPIQESRTGERRLFQRVLSGKER